MNFNNFKNADKTFLIFSLVFFILGIGSRFFWICLVLVFLIDCLED
jgi:hypothetical protein